MTRIQLFRNAQFILSCTRIRPYKDACRLCARLGIKSGFVDAIGGAR
jgi:hypothetical protein